MKSNNFAFYVVPKLNKTFPRKIEKLIYAQGSYPRFVFNVHRGFIRDLCSVYKEVLFEICVQYTKRFYPRFVFNVQGGFIRNLCSVYKEVLFMI